MSFMIRGLGTAHPPDALSPDDGLGIARFLAGPYVRTSTWLVPLYANSGIK
jgi:alpha-pyrone synthase